jgi:hypothetical protein
MSEAGVAGTCETGGSSFGATGISVTGVGDAMKAGAAGLDSKILGAAFADGGTTTGETGRGTTATPVEAGEPTAGSGVIVDCGGAPRRSLGKRIPQKPMTDSVNSNST